MTITVGLHHVTRYGYDKADRPRSPGGAASPGAALPDPGAELLAHGHARTALRQLAAGPARQLARPFRLPGEDHRVLGDGRSHRRSRSRQSVRLFRRAVCREVAIRLPAELREDLAAYLPPEPAGPRLRPCSRRFRASRATPSISWSSSISVCAPGPLCHPAGAGRSDGGRDAGLGAARAANSAWLLVQVLRHIGLAARFVSGYLIQLKPDLKSLDGPGGADAGLHRPARLDRSLSARRGLDRARSHLRPVMRGGPSAGGGDAALPLGRADHRRGRARQGRRSRST